MISEAEVSRQLDRIRKVWPNLPAGDGTGGYWEALRAFEAIEVHNGVTLLLQEYDSPAHPKPATITNFVRRVVDRRRFVIAPIEGEYCLHCHTRTLVEVVDSAKRPDHARVMPLHNAGCVSRIEFPEGTRPWPPPRSRGDIADLPLVLALGTRAEIRGLPMVRAFIEANSRLARVTAEAAPGLVDEAMAYARATVGVAAPETQYAWALVRYLDRAAE